MEKENIFRKESMNHISSPEQLDTYLKVTSPLSWAIFLGILILLSGFVAWGIFGHLEKRVQGTCQVKNNKADIYLEINSGNDVPKEGMEAYIKVPGKKGDVPATIQKVSRKGGYYIASAASKLPDGKYDVDVVTWNVTPVSFILNN